MAVITVSAHNYMFKLFSKKGIQATSATVRISLSHNRFVMASVPHLVAVECHYELFAYQLYCVDIFPTIVTSHFPNFIPMSHFYHLNKFINFTGPS